MSDTSKFEKMLELLVNEDKEAAQELFHEIVVEKSRDIYEGLLEDETDVEETTDEEVEETTDEEVEEATDEEVDETTDEEVEENFYLDEFEVEADDDMGPMDQTGDLANDLGMSMDDEEGDEDEGEEGDVEDRVEDLEDALEDLKAEFEKMMAGDEGDDMDDEEPEEEAFAYEATDEEVEEAADDEVEEATDEEVEEAADDEVEESKEPQTAGEQMREYVEKVSATMGDNGANTKSVVASANDMGGDAGNIAQGADEKGGSADNAKEDSAGNVNVPGGKASKSMKSQPGHGAEKKGKPETADNKKPTIGG